MYKLRPVASDFVKTLTNTFKNCFFESVNTGYPKSELIAN